MTPSGEDAASCKQFTCAIVEMHPALTSVVNIILAKMSGGYCTFFIDTKVSERFSDFVEFEQHTNDGKKADLTTVKNVTEIACCYCHTSLYMVRFQWLINKSEVAQTS